MDTQVAQLLAIRLGKSKVEPDRTADLDCLRREPLDLAEESVCADVDWLEEGAADCEHDLSTAQSMDTQDMWSFSYFQHTLSQHAPIAAQKTQHHISITASNKRPHMWGSW